MNEYKNVVEMWNLYDTILIGPTAKNQSVPGWVENYSDLASMNELNFYNVRNSNCGRAYNNQDARDRMPYPMRLHSVGVEFWSHSMSQYNYHDTVSPPTMSHGAESKIAHMFASDIPRHCSAVLTVQQDERLRAPVCVLSPGYGICGGGYGQGSARTSKSSISESRSIDPVYDIANQGTPDLLNRFPLPGDIDVPKGANISLTLNFSEYAKAMLNMMWIKYQQVESYANSTSEIDTQRNINACAGIRVSLFGYREVQQRGEYHY